MRGGFYRHSSTLRSLDAPPKAPFCITLGFLPPRSRDHPFYLLPSAFCLLPFCLLPFWLL